jgi:hypothetical protein
MFVISKPQILSEVNTKGQPIGLSNKKIEYHCIRFSYNCPAVAYGLRRFKVQVWGLERVQDVQIVQPLRSVQVVWGETSTFREFSKRRNEESAVNFFRSVQLVRARGIQFFVFWAPAASSAVG